MSQKANPTSIGLFILGAVTLILVLLFVFSGGGIFNETKRLLLVFEGSVKGLNVGAPVSLKGVRIGEVEEIEAYLQSDDLEVLTLVTIEIDPHKIKQVGKRIKNKIFLQDLIHKGLRGKLKFQSLVTGLLYVEFDFYPDSPVNYHNDISTKLVELPVLPENLEALTKSIQKMDLPELAENLHAIIIGLKDLITSPTTKALGPSLNTTLKEVGELVSQLNTDVPDIAEPLKGAIEGLDKVLQQMQHLTASVDYAVSDNSPVTYKVEKAADEISRSAIALRHLAETLERNPESIIKGKPHE